ncbi:MAG: hypothetical protein DCC50_05580 [Acidobacteria bacterium]|nr:MAG: hypothetical protein DCC50_05580 [Acidobacteriota bacterium]
MCRDDTPGVQVSAIRCAESPMLGRLGEMVGRAARHRGLQHLAAGRAAQRDELTGLWTRSALAALGPRLLRAASRRGEVAGVIFFDVDDFKWVNDTFGHSAGDEVLRTLGARVRAVVRDKDLAVRFGGDEFVVVLSGLPTMWGADVVTERLRHALEADIALGETSLTVQVSAGIALLGVDGFSLAELLDAADHAAYTVKRNRQSPWHRHSPASDARTGPRPTGPPAPNAEELRRAIHDGGLLVHLQPQVDAATGSAVGFEALSRWEHPRLGLLGPRDIVSLAEREGLKREVTHTILDKALACHAVLRKEHPDSRMAVNISTRSLLDEQLAPRLAELLARHGTHPGKLTVEITEPAVSPSAAVSRALGRLESLGCRLGLHEYGTGQTSLTSVATNRAVRELQLAPGLAGRVLTDPDARRLVRAVISMAHSLELEVVGEGVESTELAAELRHLGCDVLQGFHIQAPAPLPEVLAWTRAWPAASRTALGLGPGQ